MEHRIFFEEGINYEEESKNGEHHAFTKALNGLHTSITIIDRIVAPLLDKEGVVIAHKTGSGVNMASRPW